MYSVEARYIHTNSPDKQALLRGKAGNKGLRCKRWKWFCIKDKENETLQKFVTYKIKEASRTVVDSPTPPPPPGKHGFYKGGSEVITRAPRIHIK
jgi:hypothetical protein